MTRLLLSSPSYLAALGDLAAWWSGERTDWPAIWTATDVTVPAFAVTYTGGN